MHRIRINHCVDCEFFHYGHNDPMCDHPENYYYDIYPKCGIYADEPPPKNCPLRKQSYIKELYVD